MALCRWDTAPEPVQGQVKRFMREVRNLVGDNLSGVYLHGSLAMGCFNPDASDVDLLLVVRHGLSTETRRLMAALLLTLSGEPRPLEVHFIREEDLQQWRHPFPYDFHYSEGWRDRYKENLTDLTWEIWRDRELTDVDLAAHFTIVRERGVALFGPAPRQVLPEVPPSDYAAAIVADYEGAMAAITEAPVYGVLNMLRVWWYLSEGRICSKEEAGVWGVQRLSDLEARSVAATALDRYRGGEETAEFLPAALEQFVHTVDTAVERFVSQGPAAHRAPFAPMAPPLAPAPPAYGAMRCPHCGVALEYRGEGRFEAAAPVDLAMYACPSCGRAEFYVRR